MTVSLIDLISWVSVYPMLGVTALLTTRVILASGWTDAPNVITTCVSTRTMAPRAVIMMAVVFNSLGVFVMTSINASAATTIYNMVDFSGNTHEALVVLYAALSVIAIWVIAIWWFGILTSESYVPIAGLFGVAIILYGGLSGINGAEWIKAIYGLVLSTLLGFAMGWGSVKITQSICCKMGRRRTTALFQKAQIGGGAAMAFIHGAQDGQKFMGVFMLGMFLVKGEANVPNFQIPIWLMLFCSPVIGLGTSIDGYCIIRAVDMDTVRLKKHQDFTADLAAAACLLLSSLTSIPASITHTKTTSIMGVGTAKRLSSANWGIVDEMVVTWVLTFPGCGIIGFLMAKLFMTIF